MCDMNASHPGIPFKTSELMTKLDFSEMDFEEFFGCVNATNTTQMKSSTFRTFRTYIQEKSFAKWSGGQLAYVGDHRDGLDFESIVDEDWEMKGSLNMFNKNGRTKVVTIKNFYGETKVFKKTFDYIFLVDTESMSIGYTDWETTYKRHYFTDKSPLVRVRYEPQDYKMIVSNVTPTTKSITASEILKGIEHIL